ncbi:hypothetical protein SAMN05216315_10345 [Nitrosospira sp. Nsp18]|nr:hypothetical protein SAMN05216315_10345 [Nitrosospira sp. Nsp18]
MKSAANASGRFIFRLFSTNRITIGLQNPQNLPSPVTFSLRFFKSHRLLDITFFFLAAEYDPAFVGKPANNL